MELDVCFVSLSELPREAEALRERILSLPFGEAERRRLLGLKNESARRQSLGAWLALQCLTEARRWELPREVCRTDTGKPYFADLRLPNFTLSHSGALCVAALGDRPDAPVGVDLQAVDTRRSTDGIAARFFSPRERQECAEDTEPPHAFFRIWSRKDAAVKLGGEGLGAMARVDTHSRGIFLITLSLRIGGQTAYLSLATAEEITVLRTEVSDGIHLKIEEMKEIKEV